MRAGRRWIGGGGYSNESTATLLEQFDENVRAARHAIAAATDPDYDVPWSLKLKGNVVFTCRAARSCDSTSVTSATIAVR
jgi:hypothetical protein